ncbi:hypothetical protein ATHSA_0710 [Athalassotoga saccharophila]|nr:hypothetical protein ATHSA_0710 [Athalassotoga saccharophila]
MKMRQRIEKIKDTSIGILIEVGYSVLLIGVAFLIGYLIVR